MDRMLLVTHDVQAQSTSRLCMPNPAELDTCLLRGLQGMSSGVLAFAMPDRLRQVPQGLVGTVRPVPLPATAFGCFLFRRLFIPTSCSVRNQDYQNRKWPTTAEGRILILESLRCLNYPGG